MHADPRRAIPQTNSLLADARLAEPQRRLGRHRVRDAVHTSQERVRAGSLAPEQLMDDVLRDLPARATTLRPVINATGTVLHTNLGRAPLSAAARDALLAAAGYVDVEYDLVEGRRAPRGRGTLGALRRALPDAGDVMVVNNGAAALLLAVTVLAAGREVVWSRGELVEIGDGFRLPDLVACTGATLREVGTTNRTAVADYMAALGERTGCVLKVHARTSAWPDSSRRSASTSSRGSAHHWWSTSGPACCRPTRCSRTNRTSPEPCAPELMW